MKQMSLMSICQKYGLSRRIIQGYEKEGLVKADAKTQRGYLLYDEKTIQRIILIRYFQNIGYHLKEIGEFIDKPAVVLQTRIRQKLPDLENKLKYQELLIEDSKAIIALLDREDSDDAIFMITEKENVR